MRKFNRGGNFFAPLLFLVLLTSPIEVQGPQRRFFYKKPVKNIPVQITSYQLDSSQTDDTPLESASGKDLTNHPNACAISRDLKKMYRYGDSILLHFNGRRKYYVVEDIMNKRYTRRVDILTKGTIRTFGKIIRTKH